MYARRSPAPLPPPNPPSALVTAAPCRASSRRPTPDRFYLAASSLYRLLSLSTAPTSLCAARVSSLRRGYTVDQHRTCSNYSERTNVFSFSPFRRDSTRFDLSSAEGKCRFDASNFAGDHPRTRAAESIYFESISRIEPTTFRREVINRNTRIEKGETARGDELQRPNRDKGRYHLEQRGERERLPRSDPTYSRAAR